MRVAIMGSGGVGGYYGGMLARAGNDVTFIARGEHLHAMLANGLRVKTAHVGEFAIPAKATEAPHEIGPVDLVLFCVKTLRYKYSGRDDSPPLSVLIPWS